MGTRGVESILNRSGRLGPLRGLFASGLALLGGAGMAQVADFRQRPEAIAFADWTKVADTPTSIEYEISFSSPAPSGVAQNDTVPLQVWLPARREGPVPVVIILHYWGALDVRAERSTAVELNRRGVAGVVVHLPYHLKRTPAGARSGQLAIVPKPESMIRTMAQGVLDVRRAVDWVESRPEFATGRIGIAGTSLGAIVAAVVCGVEPRVRLAAFVLGGADLAHILWNSSRVVKERDQMRREGLTEERLRTALAPIEPLRFLPEAKLDRSYVIGARYDSVIPAADTQKLIDALGDAKFVWLDTGHYGGFLIQRQVQRSAAAFFSAEFSGREFEAPKRISAPTVRIGTQFNAETGMQLALGLDVWRGTARGDTFASLMLTLRGTQVFVGFQAERGLAIGVVGFSGGIRPAAVWSVVL